MQFNPAKVSSPARLRFVTKYTRVTPANRKWSASQINIDNTTNTVTINGHGLTSTDLITVLFDGTYSDNNPDRNIPSGLTAVTRYYPINITTNTFQLSATSGGTAISLGTVYAYENWRMEATVYSNGNVTLNNLGGLKRFRLVTYGASQNSVSLSFNVYGSLYGTSITYTSFGMHQRSSYGYSYMDFRLLPDNRFSGIGYTNVVHGANGTQASQATITVPHSSFANGVTSITLDSGGTAWYDGFTIEVYEIMDGENGE